MSRGAVVLAMALVATLAAAPLAAQDMPGMAMPSPTPAPTPAEEHHEHGTTPMPTPAPEQEHEHDHAAMAMPGHEHAAMSGLLGHYPMSREASGTAWQPEEAPHGGAHANLGAWEAMGHFTVVGLYTDQGSDRGDDDLVSVNMAMGIAQRPLGAGRLGLKAMVSLEPATVGSDGYPLLLQTGETADGRTPLVDRQHPHDFLMELAATYAVAVSATDSLFAYVALPGEPALGPPAYMHRWSGLENPETPLAHHWLDSTHISWGVVTAGWAGAAWKVEASAFRGREPDEQRWDVEEPRLDSGALRLSWNPSSRWALQASWGRLHSPEQLEPEVDLDRATASAMYVAPLGDGLMGATLAWGRNDRRPGATTDAWLLEGSRTWGSNTVFVRAEWLENDEIVAAVAGEDEAGVHVRSVDHGHGGEVVTTAEINAGYMRDFYRRDVFVLGAGGSGRVSFVPRELESAYGDRRPLSWLVMLRAAVR